MRMVEMIKVHMLSQHYLEEKMTPVIKVLLPRLKY